MPWVYCAALPCFLFDLACFFFSFLLHLSSCIILYLYVSSRMHNVHVGGAGHLGDVLGIREWKKETVVSDPIMRNCNVHVHQVYYEM